MTARLIHFSSRYALILMLQILFACDSLEEKDKIHPTLAQSEYYILPRSSVIIDLTSLANQSLPNVSISISKNSIKGSLIEVGTLLFKYKPTAGFTNGVDQFDIYVKSDGNIVLTKKIKIYTKASKEQFPCALITLEDKVEARPGSTISIAVLNNDWFCGIDNSSLTLSIHSNPLHGQTVVDGELINYIPGFDYRGKDEFIYRLTSSIDERIYYGIVSIADPLRDFEEVVYIAGSELTSDRSVAKVWGTADIQLPNYGQYGSTATSIFLSGDDLYVVGYEDNWPADCDSLPCPAYAMLWKNGVAQPLTNGNNEAGALSVFVSNDDVYVAGYDSSDAILWKNGVPIRLSDGTASAQATSVFVSNGDVYVVGAGQNGATLWKNGKSQSLSGGSYATSVFVSGNDVYVAGGNDMAHGMVWKNGVAQTLFSQSPISYALSVYVAGEDVYVAGYEQPVRYNYDWFGEAYYDPAIALVWINGVRQPLTNGSQDAIAKSISVSRDDVYVVGKDGDIAVIWKNGREKSLGEGDATGLFLKK